MRQRTNPGASDHRVGECGHRQGRKGLFIIREQLEPDFFFRWTPIFFNVRHLAPISPEGGTCLSSNSFFSLFHLLLYSYYTVIILIYLQNVQSVVLREHFQLVENSILKLMQTWRDFRCCLDDAAALKLFLHQKHFQILHFKSKQKAIKLIISNALWNCLLSKRNQNTNRVSIKILKWKQ